MEANDDIYRFDGKQQQDLLAAKPWASDPRFFKAVKISVNALLKMMMHARTGGKIEVMGMLFGKVAIGTMIVMDCFALPVEGSETRVNAHTEAYEYMSTFLNSARKVNRLENVIGWYHSHPGYGCWLSGIDVNTEMINQAFQDPFLAIVVDPVRTIATNRVHLGAFRTLPVYPGYTTDQVLDIVRKLKTSEQQIIDNDTDVRYDYERMERDTNLEKAARDGCKLITEVIRGIMTQIIKDRLFNQVNLK
ncbi:COP9 signalosome complex subunit 5-like isoform X3 [Stegodyphus dumicola]|uniref:COP9 signalosome complex subunit 5-like isoform X3 n=1 Tax=Stegodyphus dumicola TaxID=202533 RepID=UPI0015B1C797|nr:COP9 signalosome complex subunit 5-like isoform X3 [Stegodyphus dumicola]